VIRRFVLLVALEAYLVVLWGGGLAGLLMLIDRKF
jgi:hypothetical protein